MPQLKGGGGGGGQHIGSSRLLSGVALKGTPALTNKLNKSFTWKAMCCKKDHLPMHCHMKHPYAASVTHLFSFITSHFLA